ncbi:FMN-binding glutamate synthase family protein [Nisaea acidiphila]|uniref:FMN-binding glutamate synthase family protein n=1 Tax=Nisaea acidiphila TaxID=1862145 RepID=A0A9J7B2G5_9PROT|nr:FMN-binding glutamate synthase family protein [Nisaea acidiphila]UUX51853.1 FMN-binding glutamate synthase family protein [Nisaea acidiphila]
MSGEVLVRFAFFAAVVAAVFISAGLGLAGFWWAWFVFAVAAPLALLGIWDLVQGRHSLLRNYPVLAHMRWLFEGIRPEIRQYLIESDADAFPFNREQRSLVYQRAKQEQETVPFGTQMDVYKAGYGYFTHSLAPVHPASHDFRRRVGGPDCAQPYDISLFNISGMSFGALSGNAIAALNKGAAAGGFAHDTGEGSISPHHRRHGGDLIWQIASGYFGCRTADGQFDPEKFAATASDPQVKMVELKLSQGAKPGHGGVLPASKISAEIAETRGIPSDRDCVSPAAHPAFSTPEGLVDFIAELRRLSGGKPVGFKLCVGHPYEFMAICKAMIARGSYPDFIVVDGKEGGTGAAPVEFTNSLGMPLREGLHFVHMTLTGAGIRDRVRLGASGKIISGADIATALALGADWCNAARGFMFAIGCIQARACHTNRCPTGVATQDESRQRGLVVEDKYKRVANFHRNTLRGFAEMLGAMGLDDPGQIRPETMHIRSTDPTSILHHRLRPGQLFEKECPVAFSDPWSLARIDSFRPSDARDG